MENSIGINAADDNIGNWLFVIDVGEGIDEIGCRITFVDLVTTDDERFGAVGAAFVFATRDIFRFDNYYDEIIYL